MDIKNRIKINPIMLTVFSLENFFVIATAENCLQLAHSPIYKCHIYLIYQNSQQKTYPIAYSLELFHYSFAYKGPPDFIMVKVGAKHKKINQWSVKKELLNSFERTVPE